MEHTFLLFIKNMAPLCFYLHCTFTCQEGYFVIAGSIFLLFSRCMQQQGGRGLSRERSPLPSIPVIILIFPAKTGLCRVGRRRRLPLQNLFFARSSWLLTDAKDPPVPVWQEEKALGERFPPLGSQLAIPCSSTQGCYCKSQNELPDGRSSRYICKIPSSSLMTSTLFQVRRRSHSTSSRPRQKAKAAAAGPGRPRTRLAFSCKARVSAFVIGEKFRREKIRVATTETTMTPTRSCNERRLTAGSRSRKTTSERRKTCCTTYHTE